MASLLNSSGRNLISYDYEVEYLESNGLVYFDNEEWHPRTYDITIEGKMYYGGYMSESYQYAAWIQSFQSNNHSAYQIIRNYTSNTSVYLMNGIRAGSGVATGTVAKNNMYVFTLTPTTYYWNNTSISIGSNPNRGLTQTEDVPFRILNDGFIGRIYYLKVKKGEDLVLDIIPVVKNGVGCLYNKVTKTFMYNKGNGDVIVGQRV